MNSRSHVEIGRAFTAEVQHVLNALQGLSLLPEVAIGTGIPSREGLVPSYFTSRYSAHWSMSLRRLV